MSIQDMYPAVLSLVLIAILLGVGLTVLSGMQGSPSIVGTANSTISTSITAIGGFANWFTIIVVVLVAAIIIGLVISSFAGRK